jgi:alcohol dehydrogenase (cytochrome c)
MSITIKKLAFAISASVVIIIIIFAAALYWQLGRLKSDEDSELASSKKFWDAISCRAELYLQKAQGGIPELAWSEIWALSRPGNGFRCAEGFGWEAAVQYSSIASADDRRAGARIFQDRCSVCHGNDGSGGSVGPSLTRSGLSHGDSDLAIYKVVRDGVPGTAMPSAGLSMPELLRVTAYVKTLQAHLPEYQEPPRLSVNVGRERLQAAGTNTNEWLMYSGSYDGWHHTSLAEITPANVAQLRVRWIRQFDISSQNIEATPLVVDGVIFIAADAGHIFALDAKTGDVIWQYKRAIPSGLPLAFGPVNRGLAVSGSTLLFGTSDGYLVALGANDGKLIWETSVASPSSGYSVTGAPLVVNGSVIVGISGGEFGIRGFLAAYDVSNGEQQWKFYTIPGPGDVGHETWENDAWQTGGGGAWITGSYDSSTDLLYWGVGNPSPDFLGDVRPGDNLFTASVIALHASTGKLAWYFQFTPHDEHDWDSAQTPVLADLLINGVVRKVICWANRNGFYYVLDRVTGEFLTGVPFVEIDWAKGLTSTGRPVLVEAAKVSTAGRRIRPGISGGTNWQNPAFDQSRGSIFIPATESSSIFSKRAPNEARSGRRDPIGSGWSQVEPLSRVVVALDVVTGSRKWQYSPPVSGKDYSGLLATGGGLVFGASGGIFFGLDADSGREVFKQSLGGSSMAAPISFAVEGHQVLAVAAGRALFLIGP